MNNPAGKHGPGEATRERSPTDTRSWEGRHRWRDVLIFAGIVAFALGLRLIYVFQVRSSPYFDVPILDAAYHDEWARAMLAGRSFIDTAYFRAPLYPAFLAAMYGLSGGSFLFPRIVQAVLGSLTCGIAFLLGRDAFGRRVGIVSGIAAATYWILLYFDAELLIPVLITFLDTTLVWLLLRAHRRPSAGRWLVCGLILGLSAIARPNILLLAPAVVAWMLVVQWRRWKPFAVYGFCWFAGCVIPIVPITVRNYVVGDDPVLIASQGGVNFFIGNNPQSDGMSAIVPGLPTEWWQGYHAAIDRAEQAFGRALRPSEVSRYYYEQAGVFWRDQPLAAIRLTLRKLALFWGAGEIINNTDIHLITDHYAPVVRILPLGFWIVGPLGLAGLILGLGRPRELFPLWSFVTVYMVSVVMFFVTARFRVPILPVLIVLASHAVFWSAGAVRQRRWLPLGGVVAAVLVGGLVTNVIGRFEMPACAYPQVNLATTLIQKSRIDEALDELQQARRVEPGDATVYYTLGLAWTEKGDLAKAVESYRDAIARKPDYHQAHNNLGKLLDDANDTAGAIHQFEAALRAKPDHAPAHFNLARVLMKVDRDAEAVAHLDAGLRVEPDRVDALVLRANALVRLGRFAEALESLDRAVSLEPDNAAIHVGLASILARCPVAAVRNGAEAVRHARRACELTDWQDVDACLVWADALAESERFEEAIDALDQARRAIGDDARSPAAEQIELRRNLFLNRRPFHGPASTQSVR